jgi:hypothetical protein
MGFEPMRGLITPYPLSRRAHSATMRSLRRHCSSGGKRLSRRERAYADPASWLQGFRPAQGRADYRHSLGTRCGLGHLGWLLGGEAFLEGFAGRVDVDGVPAAGLLAEAAAGAAPLDELGGAKEVAGVIAADVQIEGIEGADLDAELAAAADAVVLDDDGLGPLLAGEGATDVAVLVEDGLRRADDAAGAAVDAEAGVDDVDLVARAGDGLGGATLGAGGAADAGIDYPVGHSSSSLGALAGRKANGLMPSV